MSRPRTINPKGATLRLTVRVADSVIRELQEEAQQKKTTVGAIVRERLEKGKS